MELLCFLYVTCTLIRNNKSHFLIIKFLKTRSQKHSHELVEVTQAFRMHFEYINLILTKLKTLMKEPDLQNTSTITNL